MLIKIKALISSLLAKMPSFSLSSAVMGIAVGYIAHPLIKLAISLVVSIIKLVRFL